MENKENNISELTAEQQQTLITFTTFFAKPIRTEIARNPSEYGLAYEEVSFPAMDGIELKGWFIPAESDKLIIVNHFLDANRYGYPGHKIPNDIVGFEVNQVAQYKTLHDAGYNILAYDLRNHGESESAHDGCGGSGVYEHMDVIGSIRYAKSRKDTAHMKTALYSICYGCNSTFAAFSRHPEEFSHIKALVGLQPASVGIMMERLCDNLGIDKKAGVALSEKTMYDITGLNFDQLSPVEHAKSVTIPTHMVQVHDDSMVYPSDIQTMFDNLASEDKKLFWIEGTSNRFHGYTYFNDNPELLLEWFNKYIND